MNKITTILIISGALVFSGCKKWLDVKPMGQSTKEEQFQSQKGFRDALTGAYLDLKSNDVYGNNMMYGAIELMARNWDVANINLTSLAALSNANYLDAGARASLDAIYAKEYKVVADVNSILEMIDGKQNIFQDNNYALIKGEALALRAFCHFDVLRLFGPMPATPTADPLLPYVTEVTKDIAPLLNYDDFSKKVLNDLDQADSLLKGVDPITQFSLDELNPLQGSTAVPPVSDDYYMYRQIRMNYYAVLALKARVYNWLTPRGDINRQNAVKYAQMVINAKSHTGLPTFRLGELKDQQGGDYSFTCEHIGAVNYYNLGPTVIGNFDEAGNLARYDFNIQDGFYYLNNLFPVAERATDARFVGQWSYKTSSGLTQYVKYKKFYQKDVGLNPNNQLPLLRLSEMYLILTECAQTKADAESIYLAYCNKKGIPFTSGFSAADWITDRKNRMIREYVREFYAEGQTFFTYKRYNVTTLPASWTYAYYQGTPARYVVTKPDREINYHNN